MEPDPRTYRMMRQEQAGHKTVLETRDMAEMVSKIREYASHALIESQRGLEISETGGLRITSPMVMAWLTGFTFGVLALLIAGMVTGRIVFP